MEAMIFVKHVGIEFATIQWFSKLGLKTYDNYYDKEIKHAEIVGHIDLWNL
jgi:hypothetical protein